MDFEIWCSQRRKLSARTYTRAKRPCILRSEKAVAVQNFLKTSCPVIAADTIVVLDNEIIGKPKDREDAIGILTTA